MGAAVVSPLTVMAQTAAPAAGAPTAAAPAKTTPATPPAAAAPTTAAPADANITKATAALTDLGLTDVEVTPHRKGQLRADAKLADGKEVRAGFDRDGVLRMLATDDDDDALPAEIVNKLIPDAVRQSPIFPEFATVSRVGLGGKGLMIAGEDKSGEDLRAGFTPDGQLQRFGRGDDDRMRPGPKGDRDGGPKKERHGKHDHRGPGGPGPDGRGPDGPRGPGGPGTPPPPPEPLDEAAIEQVLTGAGYTEVDDIERDGPRTFVEAINQDGENVTVEIGPRGDIVRETAR
ncbi:MAG: hypothetical protein DI498_13935 [Paracoccus denitrificans]|nr:MAG: hypothetical protein DI498_13935 [Paracoccus denitrificans]PZO82845.1 MAG: hypothetical protein DI633_13935 [Paracoccus denitrificans]